MVADVWPAGFDVGDCTTMIKTIAVIAASLVALVALGYLLINAVCANSVQEKYSAVFDACLRSTQSSP